ncbi:MAG: hypothetical protein AAF624_12580 [Bacteroidota bacterium]
MRIALCMLAAFILVALGCDSTSVSRDNLTPGLVAGTYAGSAVLPDIGTSQFTITLDPNGGPSDLGLTGTLGRSDGSFSLSGGGSFDYPSVALGAKAPALTTGGDFSFTLTTDASGTVLQGEVNGNTIRLDKQR